MLWKRIWTSALSLTAVAATMGAAQATVFMQDDFSYADGQLTSGDSMNLNGGTGANVSGGNWTATGTAPLTNGEFMQVVGGKANVLTSGTEDVSRTTGTVIPDGGTWYYAARFTVNDRRPEFGAGAIGNNYFMHFKDEGTFNLMGRLYVAPPTAAESSDFTFGLSAYSVNGTGGAIQRWGTDLPFGQEYTVVVSIKSRDTDAGTTDDAYSTLWVNPVDQASTSITDMMPHPDAFVDPDRTKMTRLSLRQTNAGDNQPQMLIDKVAIGDSFADVLAAVSAAPANNADFDTSGTVDGKDFLTWQAGYGATGQTGKTNGNANADTVVDDLDFAEWKAKFGGSPAAAAGNAVPEPATLAMAALTIAALGAARRRA